MVFDVYLCDISKAKSTIDDIKAEWVEEVLSVLGVPDDIIKTDDIYYFRHIAGKMGIDVDHCSSGDIRIYKKKWHKVIVINNGVEEDVGGWLLPEKEDLVGEWKEPIYIRKVENKKVYYELHLNQWSILDTRIK